MLVTSPSYQVCVKPFSAHKCKYTSHHITVGSGYKLFAYLYVFIALASLLCAVLLDAWLEHFGYEMLMSVIALISVVALGVLRYGLSESEFQYEDL